jgi:hypothetical protein
MNNQRAKLALIASLATTSLMLGGCAASAATSGTGSVAHSKVPVPKIGHGMMVLAPLLVSFQDSGVATNYTLTMGQSLVFVPTNASTVADWAVTSSPSGIVDFTAGGSRDGATFNPGIQGVGDGTATVTISNSTDGSTYTFTVTVSGATLAPGQVQNY